MANVIVTVPSQPVISVTNGNQVTVASTTNEIIVNTAGVTTIVTREILEGLGIDFFAIGDAKRISVDLGDFTTDSLTEGGVNRYFTQARARESISVSGSLSYNNTTGVVSYTTPTTSGITEGTNLYYTDSRARNAISVGGSLSYNSTTGVVSYTTPTTSGIVEGTNLYYTDARARSAIAVSGWQISYNNTNGIISIATPTTSDVAEGTNLYYTDARVATYLTANDYVTSGVDVEFNNIDATAINIDQSVRHNSVVKTTTTTAADQVVFTAPYKSVKLFVEVQSGGEYQALEIVMVTNGTNAFIAQYGEMATNGILATFSTDYTTGMRLLVTPVNADTVITIATIAITS